VNEGWKKQKLRDVCELVNGRAYSKPELLSDGKYRVLRVGNFFTNDHWYYSDLELEEKKYCDYGDLLYAWSASFGPRIWSGEKVIFHYHIWKVIPDRTLIEQKFLFYFFLWDTEQIKEDQGTGTTMIHVSKGSMEDRDILVPPISEQHRIVVILDEAFDGIATAKANAEKNLQNSRALFESHLQAVFSQRGDGWVEKRLEDVCVLQRGFDLPTRSRIPGDFPLVSSSGVIDTHSEGPVKGPGVATGRSGSIGNVFYIKEDYWPLNTVLYVKQFHGNNPRFVYWLLNHFDLKGFATGAGVPTLNRNFVHDELVLIPESKTMQVRIAEQFDALKLETQHLESIYQQKLAAFDELKKSLLHQAFSGQL